jgi:hypothetical protein
MTCGTGYPVVTAIAPLFHYDYQYQLPADFDRLTRNYRRYQHLTIQGQRLLSRWDSAKIEYVKKITDPTLFDTLFTEVLILTLALKLLGPLQGTQNTTFRQELKQDLKEAMMRARTVCAAENNNSGESTWNNARFKGSKVG